LDRETEGREHINEQNQAEPHGTEQHWEASRSAERFGTGRSESRFRRKQGREAGRRHGTRRWIIKAGRGALTRVPVAGRVDFRDVVVAGKLRPPPPSPSRHARTHRVCLPEYSVEETHVVAGCSLKSDSASPRARKVSARPGGRTIRAYAASRVGGRVSPWLSACLAWPSGATAHRRGEPAAFSVPLADLPPWCLGKLEKVRFAVRLPS